MVFQQEPADSTTRPKAEVPDPRKKIPAAPQAATGDDAENDGRSRNPFTFGSAPSGGEVASAKDMLDQLSPDCQKVAVWLIRKLMEGERRDFA